MFNLTIADAVFLQDFSEIYPVIWNIPRIDSMAVM